MPGISPCLPSCCATPQVVNIPGLQGGTGNNGTNGVNAFSITTADFVVPAINATVTISVTSTAMNVVGQTVMIGQGGGTALVHPGPGTFQITAIPSSSTLTGKFLGATPDVAPGQTISAGALVVPVGFPMQAPIGIAQGGTGQITAQAAAKALNTTRRLLGVLLGANFNSTADQAIAISSSKYIVRTIIAVNASVSLTTAAGGIYPAAAKGGTPIVAATQAYTALTAASKFLALTLNPAAGGPTTDVETATTVYLSLTTAQGAAATADVYIFGDDLS